MRWGWVLRCGGACCWLVRLAFSSLWPLSASTLVVPGTVGAPDRWWSMPPAPGLCAQQLQQQQHLPFQDLPQLLHPPFPQRGIFPPLLFGAPSETSPEALANLNFNLIFKTTPTISSNFSGPCSRRSLGVSDSSNLLANKTKSIHFKYLNVQGMGKALRIIIYKNTKIKYVQDKSQ